MTPRKPSPPTQPAMHVVTVPNAISAFRMALAVPLWMLLAEPWPHRWGIIGICTLAYASDLADGLIARTLKHESLFGRIIDPLADKVFIISFVVGLVLSGLVPPWFALVVVLRDALILVGGIVLRVRRGRLVQSTISGKTAVVSIGLALLVSVFGADVERPVRLLVYFVSFSCIAWSFIDYGARFIRIMREPAKA